MTTSDTPIRPSGIDLTHRDTDVRAQDDLFVHVNGRWLDEYEIPADRAVDGAFRTLFDQAEENVRAIIEAAAEAPSKNDSDLQRIGDLYASFMDTETIVARGLSPLAEDFAVIDAASSADELAEVLGRLQREGVGGGVGMYVDTDAKNSSRYIVNLVQSGLGLPDESYYRDEQYTPIRDAYLRHIARMFTLVGLAEEFGADESDASFGAALAEETFAATSGEIAGRIYELERKIAAAHWDVVRRRDAELSYNLRSFAELAAEASGFPWQLWVGGVGATGEQFAEVVVRQPSFVTGFAELWASEPLEEWKLWARWRVIRSRAPYLSDEIVEQNFDFYGRTLSGAEVNRDRWKRGVSLVEGLLGEAVGKTYVERHFPPESKTRMVELVANLIEAYRRSISNLEWMSPQTRQAALEKLEKFTPKIGYPDTWRDYTGLRIDRDDLVGNVRRGSAHESDRELNKLGGPVDRDEWFMTPQTVNAYYNPGMNEIVFPAAILQPPFFNPEADDAANYGGIGAVIGHEIGHGFDDQGAKYDGDGNMVDWWTDADRTEFGARAKMLIDQYGAFEPKALPGKKVNGELTIGENIGDLGGLGITLEAYKIALDGAEAPVLDGLTGIQRVFFGWAQVWRTKARDAEAIRRLATDPHSPPEFRCNGVVRNMDDYYTAFEVTESDELYLAPEQRVRIWN